MILIIMIITPLKLFNIVKTSKYTSHQKKVTNHFVFWAKHKCGASPRKPYNVG